MFIWAHDYFFNTGENLLTYSVRWNVWMVASDSTQVPNFCVYSVIHRLHMVRPFKFYTQFTCCSFWGWYIIPYSSTKVIFSRGIQLIIWENHIPIRRGTFDFHMLELYLCSLYGVIKSWCRTLNCVIVCLEFKVEVTPSHI